MNRNRASTTRGGMSQAIAGVYHAADLVRAGKEPGSFWVGCCASCAKPIPKPFFCSACHAVRYCSKDCQVFAWKGRSARSDRRGGFWRQGHKDECAEIKSMMAELPDVQAILKQFPWAITDSNGAFHYLLALALRSLLGEGPEFGWWIQPLPDSDLTVKNIYTSGGPPPGLFLDTHGAVLLSAKHHEENAGWKIPANEIPWLTFGEKRKPPPFPPVFEHNWTSYYKWRGLPLESPAALLLHWPLSIYHLLYRLGFVPSDTEITSTERSKLKIHCIGVEAELNCIPIFGELALLFPNTDIDIVMYGASAYKISHAAKPPALAARQYVYEYRAPAECGSGSIRIELYKESEIWSSQHVMSSQGITPDALIALNAGISTFETWRNVFEASRLCSIPFGITEYNRVCLAQDKVLYESWLKGIKAVVKLHGSENMPSLAESLDYEPTIAMNPFMRPGYVALMTSRMPSAINGYSRIITPRFPSQQK